ncbi:hypothetical protein D3C85_1505220 [compost metagenome]
MQDAGEHRVEEGLRQLRLLVVGQEADEVQLGLLPDLVVQQIGVVLVLQALHRLVHSLVVELDAVAHQLLHPLPVRRLEQRLGLLADRAEQPVVAVEAVHQGLRDLARHRVVVFGDLHRGTSLAPAASRRAGRSSGTGDE